MAIRVQNTGVLDFGIVGASVTVSHIRFAEHTSASNANARPVVKQLGSNVSAANGERLRIAAGALDLVYNEGDFTDAHIQNLVTSLFNGTKVIYVDLMTSSTQAVAVSGYRQQNTAAWSVSSE